MSYGKWKALQPPIEVELPKTEPQRPCGICGKEIRPEVNGNAKYCSPECYQQAHNAKNRERYLRQKLMAPRKHCSLCGKEFPPEAKGYSKYCSPECGQEAHRIKVRELNRNKKERMMANGKI